MPYLSASVVVIHYEEVLYQLYVPFTFTRASRFTTHTIIIIIIITSDNEVMFSSALICLSAGLRKNYLTDFRKIRWKGGTWVTEEPVRFCC